ncbi:unnamed protein product [Effrenium voratum]|uniref:Uncharacterized protein n=1 Tax=Effrenium voratum TaxID=2562239 RepID=A0AA36IT29_9DINO|nr:unnamed protein product [Effrenium voratum]
MGGTGRDATHGAEAPEPELDVMYLRYKQQPIDTTPVFNRMDVEYNATMDFKMEFFAVQATALGEAIITNIYLCPKADCHQETPRAMVDFSRRVSLDPGEKTLYKFDVELQGHLIVQGNTLYPKFRPDILRYRCFLEVGTEFGLLELHLLDQGQTVLAEAEAPVKLAEDNITSLDNTNPEQLHRPPLRRLREEAFGEFQYPNKYLQFPVPMGFRRTLRFKVTSADGGRFGYYRLDLARQQCSREQPLFDVSRGCVRFCNMGYWPDFGQSRCKRCPGSCLSCSSRSHCLRCPQGGEAMYFLEAGQCIQQARPFWQRHGEQVLALALGGLALLIFLCGLLGFACRAPKRGERGERSSGSLEFGTAFTKQKGYRQLPDEDPEVF